MTEMQAGRSLLRLDGVQLITVDPVKSLGVWLDSALSLDRADHFVLKALLSIPPSPHLGRKLIYIHLRRLMEPVSFLEALWYLNPVGDSLNKLELLPLQIYRCNGNLMLFLSSCQTNSRVYFRAAEDEMEAEMSRASVVICSWRSCKNNCIGRLWQWDDNESLTGGFLCDFHCIQLIYVV